MHCFLNYYGSPESDPSLRSLETGSWQLEQLRILGFARDDKWEG